MLCLCWAFSSQAGTLTLKLTCLIQGYYDTNGQMVPAAQNQGCPWSVPGMTDRISVQLRKAAYPYSIVGLSIVSLPTSGQVTANITHPNLHSGSYYIVVKNTNNALETWSAEPVAFTEGQTTHYNFTDKAEKAYGNNQYKITDPDNGTDYYCFYSGDVNHDGNIDLIDENQLENDILNFASGCTYTDLSGDGNVDLLDMAIFETNAPPFFVHVKSPLTGSKGGNTTTNPPLTPRNAITASQFEVSPNPCSGYINIRYSTAPNNNGVEFQLTDVTNRVLLTLENACTGDCTERVDLPLGTSAGLYFLKVIENGKTMSVKKIMVQN